MAFFISDHMTDVDHPPCHQHPITDVVCAVITDTIGRVLACKRPEGKHLAGLWEFPGGKVEPAENPEDALKREILEELAVDIVIIHSMTPVEWDYGSVRIRLQPYVCRIVSGEPNPSEHEELLWCHPNDFGDLDWAAADRPILEEMVRKSV
jgi:8-oxo-dGTP diphosphatase